MCQSHVILKLLAAAADLRRQSRDLADVQYALEAFPEHARGALSVAGVRARLRDLYGVTGSRLTKMVALFRKVTRRITRDA